MDNIMEILECIDYGLVALILLEILRDFFLGNQTRNWRETLANLSIYIGNNLIGRTAIATTFVVGLYLVQMISPFSIVTTPWAFVILLVLTDFTYYWKHRVEHVIRFFWAYHSVHHSSSDYDLSTAYRLPWIGSMLEWVFFVPLVFIGFDPMLVVVTYNLVLIYQFWIHTQKIRKLPAFVEGVFNTPSHHRVHHASNGCYIDKNFGGVFILWDRIFGTFAPETETVVFGLTKPIGSINPLVINFLEFVHIFRDAIRAKSWVATWHAISGHPGKQS